MCEYCEKGKNISQADKEYYNTFISKGHFGYSLMFRFDNYIRCLGFIKYCPMCGRKLGGTKQ